ncbi:hypothetical protein Csa_017480 [Cucumis sativus]|uniref:Uncharacterized protein n=1 Tax=Cucumis sativus TaxID=3659 RepID=A0A0A0L8R3_CUCSA|nr:hypothetical protein Csa_017480 [Cucumis sativus]
MAVKNHSGHNGIVAVGKRDDLGFPIMETKTATRGREKPTEVSLLRVLKSAVNLNFL